MSELAAVDLPPSGGLRLGLTQGLGEPMPRPLFGRSGFAHQLAIVPVADFKPQVDLWLLHGEAKGALAGRRG